MKRQRNGAIQMKVTELPAAKFFHTYHQHLTSSRAIFHPELEYLHMSDLQTLLQKTESGIYEIRKIRDKPYTDLSWLISMRRELPDSILLGWDRVRVRPIEPKPVH